MLLEQKAIPLAPHTSHSSLFFPSIFQELSFHISAPMIYGTFTPCFPSLLKKEGFFFCICASVCWRRNRPWPPSGNPRTSTRTRLISSACASYRLPPFPACHPHPWMTGLLKPTRPNPLILLLRGCPADWSLDPYFLFFFLFLLPKHSQGSWHGSILPPRLGLACRPDFCCTETMLLFWLDGCFSFHDEIIFNDFILWFVALCNQIIWPTSLTILLFLLSALNADFLFII